LTHISTYLNKRKDSHNLTLSKLFDQFEEDKDGQISIEELTKMF